jgi:phosphoglycerate-specific signal transduction histidine kinase
MATYDKVKVIDANKLYIIGYDKSKKIKYPDNVIKVRTKKFPQFNDSAFYTDNDFNLIREKIDRAFHLLNKIRKSHEYENIIIDINITKNLYRSPKLKEYLNNKLLSLF